MLKDPKKASLYAVWLAIDSFIKHCTVKIDDEHLMTFMKTKTLCYIEKRFELYSLHRMSTFLHPNFKNLCFASEQNTDGEVTPDRRSSLSSIESEFSNYLNDFIEEDEVEKYIRLNFCLKLMSIQPYGGTKDEKIFHG